MTDPLLPQFSVKIGDTDLTGYETRMRVDEGVSGDQLVAPLTGALSVEATDDRFLLSNPSLPDDLKTDQLVEVRLTGPLPKQPVNILYEAYTLLGEWDATGASTFSPDVWTPQPPSLTIPAYTAKDGTAYPNRTFHFVADGNTSVPPLIGIYSQPQPHGTQVAFAWWQEADETRYSIADLVFRVSIGSVTATLNGSAMTQVGTTSTGGGLTGYIAWEHANHAQEMMLTALSDAAYNYRVQIWKADDGADTEYPLISRMRSGLPRQVLNGERKQLRWRLTGRLFEKLPASPHTPTSTDPARVLARTGGHDIFAEAREVVALMGFHAHESLVWASGGPIVGEYQTPDTFHEWLRGLARRGRFRILEKRDNRIAVITSDTPDAAELDVSGLERRDGWVQYHSPRTDVRRIYLLKWREGDSFFRMTGNLVRQTEARYAGSSTGFYRAMGGADDPLPDGEIIA